VPIFKLYLQSENCKKIRQTFVDGNFCVCGMVVHVFRKPVGAILEHYKSTCILLNVDGSTFSNRHHFNTFGKFVIHLIVTQDN